MVASLMSLGVKAMSANYAALQTTGHNVANASVEGYSRQRVELSTAKGVFTGAGFMGSGVDVTTVARTHEEFLTREAAATRSLASMDAARLTQLRALDGIFRGGEEGLGHGVNQLMQAFSDLASRPSDLASRQVVLARASDLAKRFAAAADSLNSVQHGLDEVLATGVAEVNGLTRSIAEINGRIAALRGTGQPPNDLLDERERLVSKLSSQLRVTRVEADDGTMTLFAGGGQRLVLGSEAVALSVVPDADDPGRGALAVSEYGFIRRLPSAELGGGALAGVLKFQNDDLGLARNRLGLLAAGFGMAVNAQQKVGLNLQPPAGTVPSSALFDFGPQPAQPHVGNARDAGGTFIGAVTLTRVDGTALKASDYELREADGSPGSWQITRLTDGLTRAVASGDVVDGFRIDFGAPGPQGGDRFLLQPVAYAAQDMTALLNDPRDVAAASALVGSVAAANVGTAAVTGVTVSAAPLPVPGGTTTFTFTSDSGDYDWVLTDAGGAVVGSGSASWAAGQTLPAPPLDINAFALRISGVPRSGDTLTVAPTVGPAVATNNGNAFALEALRDAAVVDGATANDDWADAVARIGVRVQSGRTAADFSAAVAERQEAARNSFAGVNLDEEAANLIHYQQSYQAAAKVLQVAQALFDSLLQAAAGR